MGLRAHRHLWLGLVASYLLLALFVNPILLDHYFASSTEGPHSDRDACVWLDHATAAAIPAVSALPHVADTATLVSAPQVFLAVTDECYVAPIRGPPLSH